MNFRSFLMGICLAAAAFAVNSFGQIRTSTETTVVQDVTGPLVANGSSGYDERGLNTVFGVTLLGRAKGDLPGSTFFSMNRVADMSSDGEYDVLSSGSWAFAVYSATTRDQRTQYLGSIFGSIRTGQLPSGNTPGHVIVKLTVTGGTGQYVNAAGEGYLEGDILTSESGQQSFNGTMTVTYGTSMRY